MCIDTAEAQRAVDKYCDMYPAFQDTRECKLVRVGGNVIILLTPFKYTYQLCNVL